MSLGFLKFKHAATLVKIECGLGVASCGLLVASCGLRVAGCVLRVKGWRARRIAHSVIIGSRCQRADDRK